MKSQVIIKLTPTQIKQLSPLMEKVEKAASDGKKGMVLMQPYENKDFAGSIWTIIKAAFVPNKIAKKMIKLVK